ncbi:MAG: exodeoxyribonuclease V beta subunit [Glaciecola sp.]|jgi:exodeoxyribonuclease V beta subunit
MVKSDLGSTQANSLLPKNLDPLALELNCRHLIEASAGTGKTFNITRLYARLILEKKLSVQEILVMTYTRAATEEIKSRVAAFLLEIHNEWRSDKPSEFTQTMIERVGIDEGDALLTAALLSLDEASIFTIHGFCQRVLKQFAVSLNADLELELLTDSSDLILESVQDYLRVLSKNEHEFALLSSKNWHIPDNFFSEFRSAISSYLSLSEVTMADIEFDECESLKKHIQESAELIQELFNDLKANKSIFFNASVNGHKDEVKRSAEWDVLIDWFIPVLDFIDKTRAGSKLNQTKMSHEELVQLLTTPAEMGTFTNGNRFRSSAESKELLEPLKLFRTDLKKSLDKSIKNLEQRGQLVEVLSVVKQGIYSIRERIEKAKQKAHVVLFDDLISVFANALQKQSTNLVDAIRKQFPVALVDEFQDTDRHQYQILDLLYPKADKNSLLLMIGDPKQAIYGFRGGDIFVYLAAKQDADYIWFMDTNWRSSSDMVQGYNRLFWGHSLQEEQAREVFGFDIHYEKINSTEKAKAAASPLSDSLNSRAAMTYMLSTDGSLEAGSPTNSKRKKAELEEQVLEWSSLEILRLLSDAKIGDEAVVPADIAILVKDKVEASLVKNSLDAVGLSAVYLSDKTPLFTTPQAIELYRVLDAILHSTDRSILVAGANSSLLSRVLFKDSNVSEARAQLAELHNDLMHPMWDKLVTACFQFKEKWQEQGIFSLLLGLIKENYTPVNAAERSLTNMMHLAEAMAKNAVLNKLPEQQLAWLSHQIFDHVSDEEMQLRLESDANLIKIVTQHGSKGLEYPIVFVPFGNKYKDPSKRNTSTIQHFKYQDIRNKQTKYQLGATQLSLDEFTKQENAERMRLLYVAVTRAEHRCYLGIVDDVSNSDSALNTALGIPSGVLNDCKALDAEPHSLLPAWLGAVDESSIADVNVRPQALNQYEMQSDIMLPEYVDATLSQRSAWLISSFSNLSRFQRNNSVGHYDLAQPNQISLHAIESASEHSSIGVELPNETPQSKYEDKSAIRYQLEKGADTGNLLHDILEDVDFTDPNWDEASSVALSKYHALSENERIALFDWLESCLKTPLNNDFCLAELGKSSTLREAEFYFPMPNLKVRDVAKVMHQYRQHVQKRRALPALPIHMGDIPELSGMMHGFIDLIFEKNDKYYVADYKSTHLGDSSIEYSTEHMHKNNQQHLYDLQYLLYSLALHKYLKQQLPNYSFEKHFGGVYYLYLRGMSPDFQLDGESCGVFFDKIELQFIQQLEELFSPEKLEV